MLISCILPRLVKALLQRAPTSFSSFRLSFSPFPSLPSDFYLQQTPHHLSSSSNFQPSISQPPSSSIWTVDSLASLVEAGNDVVPLLNFFLGLLVIVVVMDDRVDNLLAHWFTSPESLHSDVPSHQPHSGDVKARSSALVNVFHLDNKVDSLAASTQPQRLARTSTSGLEETLLLVTILSVMLSMIFISNSVFDNFVAANLLPTDDLTLLRPLASLFGSFTFLVLFILALLLVLLLSALLTTCLPAEGHADREPFREHLRVYPIITVFSLVLLASSGLSRFPLAFVTLLQPSFSMAKFDLPHVAMLALEPGALGLMVLWVVWRSRMEVKERRRGGVEEEV